MKKIKKKWLIFFEKIFETGINILIPLDKKGLPLRLSHVLRKTRLNFHLVAIVMPGVMFNIFNFYFFYILESIRFLQMKCQIR